MSLFLISMLSTWLLETGIGLPFLSNELSLDLVGGNLFSVEFDLDLKLAPEELRRRPRFCAYSSLFFFCSLTYLLD
jgi:hypothetical protein